MDGTDKCHPIFHPLFPRVLIKKKGSLNAGKYVRYNSQVHLDFRIYSFVWGRKSFLKSSGENSGRIKFDVKVINFTNDLLK